MESTKKFIQRKEKQEIWKKEFYNKVKNIYALVIWIQGIEVAFLNRPDFNGRVWQIRFDKEDYMGNPKILGITEKAFHWILKFRRSGEIMDYLKKFIPHYLKTVNYDFDKIPDDDLIMSGNFVRLPKFKQDK